jgi:nucleotide-binding universal stress UspA family protein
MNTKPIAVATNDSEQSRAAVAWAAHRAERAKLPLTILHVVDDRWMAEPNPWIKGLHEAGDRLLQAVAARARQAFPISINARLLTGGVGRTLGKYSGKASMLVVGSGSGHLGGSLADRALQVSASSKCPVAVIGTQDLAGRRGVVVGVDGSEESTQAVAFAAAEADREGQDLTVIYAFYRTDRPEDAGLTPSNLTEVIMEEERIVLAETIAGLDEDYPDLKVHHVLETNNGPVAALVEAGTEAQMLVVGSRGRGGIKRLLLGSTAHGVLKQLPCPTVITRIKRIKHTDT